MESQFGDVRLSLRDSIWGLLSCCFNSVKKKKKTDWDIRYHKLSVYLYCDLVQLAIKRNTVLDCIDAISNCCHVLLPYGIVLTSEQHI